MARPVIHRKARGAAIVEAAIVLPLVALLTFGAIELGWAVLKSQQVTNATRQAARLAARPDATNEEIQSTVASLMSSAGIAGYQLTMSDDVSTVPPGNLLTVTIEVPYSNVALMGVSAIPPVPSRLFAEVTMAKEGP